MSFGIFLGAALILAASPGPGMLYVLGQSLRGGLRPGILSALGTFAGGLVHVIAAGVGISTVLMMSAVAFGVVKYAGAAYLIYLGMRTLLSHEEPAVKARGKKPHFFVQGVLVEALNPKTALFFLSFIPQFVDPARGHVFAQFIALGTVSVALNTLADMTVVSFAGPIGQRLASSARLRRGQRVASGSVLFGLGLRVAASGHR